MLKLNLKYEGGVLITERKLIIKHADDNDVSDLSHNGFKSTEGAEVKPCEGKLVIFTANPTVPVTQLNCTYNGKLDFDYNNAHYTHQVLNETRVELNGEHGVNFIDS